MRKRVEEEMAKMEQERDENRVKIKRSDKEAFRKVRATRRQFECNLRGVRRPYQFRLTFFHPHLFSTFLQLLEQQPFADADDSFFEEEAYDNVSALLGERATPFLGIPVGPLQVGHFVGSLAIILMAFVEYPGFPLTNLPTPLRDALQGGAYMSLRVCSVAKGYSSRFVFLMRQAWASCT
jgi:hypothetical protein